MSPIVPRLIKALKKHHSVNGEEASLRDLSRIYEVSHQTLGNWARGSEEHFKLLNFIEKAKKALALNETMTLRKLNKRK